MEFLRIYTTSLMVIAEQATTQKYNIATFKKNQLTENNKKTAIIPKKTQILCYKVCSSLDLLINKSTTFDPVRQPWTEDIDILRAVPLRSTLRNFGSLWRMDPGKISKKELLGRLTKWIAWIEVWYAQKTAVTKLYFVHELLPTNIGGFHKNGGFSPQVIHLLIGFSIIFTIHFGGPPLFLETTILSLKSLCSYSSVCLCACLF